MNAVDLFVDGDADDIYVADVENCVNDPVTLTMVLTTSFYAEPAKRATRTL